MQGVVNANNEPIVHLALRGPNGSDIGVDTPIDTGSAVALTLPRRLISEMALVPYAAAKLALADGVTFSAPTCFTELLWMDRWVTILVTELGSEVLLGRPLLNSLEMRIQFVRGGAVTFVPLP